MFLKNTIFRDRFCSRSFSLSFSLSSFHLREFFSNVKSHKVVFHIRFCATFFMCFIQSVLLRSTKNHTVNYRVKIHVGIIKTDSQCVMANQSFPISAHTTHNLLLIFISLKNKLRISLMFVFVRNSKAERALALAITSAKRVCIIFTKFNFKFAELIIQTIETIIFILDFPTKNTQIEHQQCMFIANILNFIRYGNCSFIYMHSRMRVFVA